VSQGELPTDIGKNSRPANRPPSSFYDRSERELPSFEAELTYRNQACSLVPSGNV
jgi:hypothetical protein